MLSIEAPDLCGEILRYPGGIHCVRRRGESMSRIILKLPVSFLLPAKINRGFKIYIVPVEVAGNSMLGLMCAIFDDADSPLVSWRLLDHCDDTLDLIHALGTGEVLVHLFDEQNRELLGYRAQIDLPLMSKIRLEHMAIYDATHESSNLAHEQALQWFGSRQQQDDAEAIQVRFVESLFPDDLAVIKVDPELYQFHGDKGHGFTALERLEPGPYQEIDIVLLLQRVFRPQQIYRGPKRYPDGEEIADVIVLTDKTCLIVQAKDSPNTEKTLNRTLKRKRLSSGHMLSDALKQLKGSVNYIDRIRPLRIQIDGADHIIDLEDRNLLSLVVVRELFADMYADYSRALFDFFDSTGLPCIALDYGELHQYTAFCRDELSFLGAYFQVFDKARELKLFPKLRFGLRDAEELVRRQEKASRE